MPKTNYVHEQRRYRREFFQKKLRNLKQMDVAKSIGVTQQAVSQKIDNISWSYDQLCELFSDDKNFSNDDILIIMGRKPDNPQENPMCKYLLEKIGEMLENKSASK